MTEHLGIWIVVQLRQLEKVNSISVDVAGETTYIDFFFEHNISIFILGLSTC